MRKRKEKMRQMEVRAKQGDHLLIFGFPGGKGKPVIVVDGSGKKGFKKWRKTTVHPTYLNKKMTARELLVSLFVCLFLLLC